MVKNKSCYEYEETYLCLTMLKKQFGEVLLKFNKEKSIGWIQITVKNETSSEWVDRLRNTSS